MTGEKNRFTTTEKLWKLNDETLSTPEHDEMVLWLLNEEHCKLAIPIINEFFEKNTEWTSVLGDIYGKIPDFWERIKEKKGIEDLVCNISNIDWLKLIDEYHNLQTEIGVYKDLKILSESPIQTHNQFIVGYWDILIRRRYHNLKSSNFIRWYGKKDEADTANHNDCRDIFIEIKPKIKSFGETLRQIKTYQLYMPGSKGYTFLFTKDLKFKDAFESQGIGVINANLYIGETR